MRIKNLLKMDAMKAIDWLIENQHSYELVSTKENTVSELKTGNLFIQADENWLHFSDADGGYDHIEISISKDSLESLRDYFDALLAERYQPAPEVKECD